MTPSLFEDNQSVASLCLAVLLGASLLWLLVSFLISWMSRRGEQRIRRMERIEHKLSAKLR